MKPDSVNSKVGRRAFFGALLGGSAMSTVGVKTAESKTVMMHIGPHCPHDGFAMEYLRPVGYTHETRWEAPFDANWVARCGHCHTEIETPRYVPVPVAP